MTNEQWKALKTKKLQALGLTDEVIEKVHQIYKNNGPWQGAKRDGDDLREAIAGMLPLVKWQKNLAYIFDIVSMCATDERMKENNKDEI